MSEMLEIFRSVEARAEVIAENGFVKNDPELARVLAEVSEPVEFAADEAIIEEGRPAQKHLYFVLSGKVTVYLGTRPVYTGGKTDGHHARCVEFDSRRRTRHTTVPAHHAPQQAGGSHRREVPPHRHPDQQLHQ